MKKYLKNSWQLLKKSFKISPATLSLVTFYDAFFYLLVYLFAMIFTMLLVSQTEGMPSVEYVHDNMMDPVFLNSITPQLYSMFYTIIISMILYALLFIFLYAIFKGLIWSRMLKRQFTLKHIKGYLYLSLIWLSSFVVITLGLSLMTREEFRFGVFLATILVFIHLTPFVYIIFTKENLIGHSLKKGLWVGIAKIHHFIIPYILIIGVGFVGIMMNTIFRLIKYLPFPTAVLIISIILTFAYLVWVRSYLTEIVCDLMHYKLPDAHSTTRSKSK